MQPTGKLTEELQMPSKQSYAVSTAACSIHDYEVDIFNDFSSHRYATDIEDEEAEFAQYYDGSVTQIQSSR